MPNNPAWHHTGEWADLMAAYTPGVPYLLPTEMLPDADCEHCKHKQDPQGGYCYMFMKRPGDKCGQFRRVEK